MPLEVRSELFERTASLLANKRGKPPAVRLDPLDTTVPPYISNRSSALSSHPESSRSFSASRSGRTPSALELPRMAHQQHQPNKPLPEAPQPRRSPRDYLQKLIHSPRFALQPPLSARSAAFLVNLQQTFLSAVDTYLYRRHIGTSHSAPYQQDWPHAKLSADLLESQHEFGHRETPKLGILRKLLMTICAMLMVTVVVLLTVFVRVDAMGSSKASHMLMGGSGILILLAALLMLAARRSLGEIMVMGVLAVLICQCVMGDFHSGKG